MRTEDYPMLTTDQTIDANKHSAVVERRWRVADNLGNIDVAVTVKPRFEFCGLPITVGLTLGAVVGRTLSALPGDEPFLTTFVNPLSFHLAKRESSYIDALRQFDLVLPDGIGIVWGLQLLGGMRTSRLSFDSTSLALPVLRRAEQEGKSVMLIGGTRGVAMRAGERLAEAIPGLRLGRAMDGFCSFPEYETAVRLAKPDIVICGMGAPRQETLLLRLKRAQAWRGLGFTCGGYFDQLQRRLYYYPGAMDRFNLRWLYRLVMEPRRLVRRYMLEYQDYWSILMHEALRRAAKYE